MSKGLRVQLIVCYVVLISIALVTGIVGQSAHKLDIASVVLLCLFVVGFSSLWTWFSIRNEHQTNARVLDVQADFDELNLRVLKGKGGTYAVVTSDALADFPAVEDLELPELEAFRDGVLAGLLLSGQYEEVSLLQEQENGAEV